MHCFTSFKCASCVSPVATPQECPPLERGGPIWKCAFMREQGPLIDPVMVRGLNCSGAHPQISNSSTPFFPGLPTSSFLPLLSHQESIFSSEHILNSSMSLHLENSDGHMLYHPHQLPCLAPSISTNHSSV